MVSWLVRLTLLAAVTMLLGACTKPSVVSGPEPVALPGDSPAASLLASAREARDRGELHAAGRYLERALDVQPGSALLYSEIAALRMDQGRAGVAEGLALRALRNAPDSDPQWRAGLWTLIAEARTRQGRGDAAEQARRRVSELQASGTRGEAQ